MLLIDRKDLRVCFKHADGNVCMAERKPGHTYIIGDETNPDSFKQLTLLEQKVLYHNMGQVPGINLTNGADVRRAICKLARYHRDSVPTATTTPLFAPDVAAAVTKTGQGLLAQTLDKVPELGIAPKGNTSRLIWDVADEMWAKAGSPKDPKVVLALRKEIMSELENNYHVKRNTSSNELGRWSKARI